MTLLSPQAGYCKWATYYDSGPNPLIALEERVLKSLLNVKAGDRVLDLATGTGRWLSYTVGLGADAIGLDQSPGMLAVAARKPGLLGRLTHGDLCKLPFPNDFAELAICSFSLSYVEDVFTAIRECARVARRVILSDMHPAAMEAGWSRSFHAGVESFQLEHFCHSKALLFDAARSAGLDLQWCVEAPFAEADRSAFAVAGRTGVFDSLRTVPAILISAWGRT